MANCIPLDPKLPANFDITPNDKRSKNQLDTWWDHPYCITHDGAFLVYCLNGGAWDRPTLFGKANTYDEACELAEKKQNTRTTDVPVLDRTTFHSRSTATASRPPAGRHC